MVALSISIDILSCKNLLKADVDSSDPYVKVSLGKKAIHETKHIVKTLNPVFTKKTEGHFVCNCTQKALDDNGGLSFRVKDYDRFSRNDELGSVTIPTHTLIAADGQEVEYTLIPPPKMKKDTDAGTITIRIGAAPQKKVTKEEVILPKAEVKPSASNNQGSAMRKGRGGGRGGGRGVGGRGGRGSVAKTSTNTFTTTNNKLNNVNEIPKQYLEHPYTADPLLIYLPIAMHAHLVAAQKAAHSNNMALNHHHHHTPRHHLNKNKLPSAQFQSTREALRGLLSAAEEDIKLHRARRKASLENDLKFLKYRLELDPVWQKRQEKLEVIDDRVLGLEKEAEIILHELLQFDEETQIGTTAGVGAGLTVSERTDMKLQRWKRALELYVHCNREVHEMDHLDVLDKLLHGTFSEEMQMSTILSKAAGMCSTLVEETSGILQDASDNVSEIEDAFHIRLEAHECFAKTCLSKTEEIQNQFRVNGRAALQIGHQLEFAESKRSQCEVASILILRFQKLEYLAEQEAQSKIPIPVDEEIGGLIHVTSCKMDPFYIMPENSLDAATALKQLRAVIRSRGNNAAAAGATSIENVATIGKDGTVGEEGNTDIMGGGVATEKNANRRFELTGNLIKRVSNSLEQRLLRVFKEIYSTSGQYDFSSKPRHGAIDWRELHAISQALLKFDSGRNLHSQYVNMVVISRFPQLFQRNKANPKFTKFDIDATRTELTTLFHLVSDVCTQEFELIAHVFGAGKQSRLELSAGNESMTLIVVRALLQRVVSDPNDGLQARINDLLDSIDRRGDFESGFRKLDTFVIIHEKVAGLFAKLKNAAECMIPKDDNGRNMNVVEAGRASVETLKGFLTSQELALSNTHRQSYINLELRLLHHNCWTRLKVAGCHSTRPPKIDLDKSRAYADKGILEEYKAPKLILDKRELRKVGLSMLNATALKKSVLRQPLINANESLARAQTMFFGSLSSSLSSSNTSSTPGGAVPGGGASNNTALSSTPATSAAAASATRNNKLKGETTAKVILSIYKQMCQFYGEGFLYPILEALKDLSSKDPPKTPPPLPFDESEGKAHNLGVGKDFWLALEGIHAAAKLFERELWAENTTNTTTATSTNSTTNTTGGDTGMSSGIGSTTTTTGSARSGITRVHDILHICDSTSAMEQAIDTRYTFYAGLESRGEGAILRALETLSTHITWILVTGGESMLATGAKTMLTAFHGQSGGPYSFNSAPPADSQCSPAVKMLKFCLLDQFVAVQSALTQQSLANFWTALSMRLYDIFVARLLNHYYISTHGALILNRDVDGLRSVAMLAGSKHEHWNILRELITLYFPPAEKKLMSTVQILLMGRDKNEQNQGLFGKAGRDQALVFLSRRSDYNTKIGQGGQKREWVSDLYSELQIDDPSDQKIELALYAAERQNKDEQDPRRGGGGGGDKK